MQGVQGKKEENAPAISQKEYLQRYLMKGKEKKVKKKKTKISSSSHIKRSVIIDDDVDLNTASNVDEEAFNLDFMGDEAPQICGYTDDRPFELQLKEKFSTGNWKSIGEMEAEEEARRLEEENKVALEAQNEDLSPPRRKPIKRDKGDHSPNQSSPSRYTRRRGRGSDSDLSPPRKSDGKIRKQDDGGRTKESHKSRGRRSDSDLSPPRKKASKNQGNDSDLSPPRKQSSKGRGNNSDLLSPRRKLLNRSKGSDSDLSPPRKTSTKRSAPTDSRRSLLPEGDRRRRSGSDSDLSPPRRTDGKKRDRDRHHRKSSPNGRNRGSDSDMSPPRRKRNNWSGGNRRVRRDDDGRDSDLSPPRKSHKRDDRRSQKLDKTLDGKTAGLQDAKRLKEELKALKDKEDKMFRKLDASVLGKSAAPVMRDRKTGQKRDLERERQAEREKTEKESIRKNKYDRWGRGLKQVRDREEQMADVLHEMSKPLARYRDDEDLDRLLKNREREGDPMLEYIRSKQEESHVVDLTVDGVRAKYRGNFMPNRFNIPPGHRWDGVDRSNGYEQKWFEAKSAKVAVEEEAWKWSSADM